MNLKCFRDKTVTRDVKGGNKRHTETERPTLSFRLKPEQQPATKTFLTGGGNEMFTVEGD